MSNTLKSAIVTCVATIMMTSGAFAVPIGVANVAVEAELSAVENQAALKQWPTLAEDLRAAIGAEVFPVTNPDGLEVSVRVISISLDGSYDLGDDGRFNTMEGVVVVKRPNEPESAQGMTIKLMATAETTVTDPDVIVVPPTSDDFYAAMIKAFAMQVGEKVTDFDK